MDLLAVQGTLKSLLQYPSSTASIRQCSAFFIVQLSHPYMTTGKTIALTRWIFVGKIMSLLFNMLSRLVITFLPRSKCLLVRYSKCHDGGWCIFIYFWLRWVFIAAHGLSRVAGAQGSSLTVSIVSPSIYHEVMGQDAMILVF